MIRTTPLQWTEAHEKEWETLESSDSNHEGSARECKKDNKWKHCGYERYFPSTKNGKSCQKYGRNITKNKKKPAVSLLRII